MLKKIESLNKKIDKINVEKTKADAQKEIWENRLIESIAEYKEQYGIDLSASSMEGIKDKLTKEIKEVEAKTVAEYEQAEKLVNLIESGDIKGAWKELGVDLDAKEEVEAEAEVGEVPTQEGLQGVSEVMEEVEELSDDDFFGESLDEEDLEDGDFFVEEEEEPEVKKDEVAPEKKDSESVKPKFSGFVFDDDDDEDEDEFVTPKSTSKSVGITLDEDEDDSDDNPFGSSFGGFGSILAGSKFEAGKK